MEAQPISGPVPAPVLSISSAVRLSFMADSNFLYQIEVSSDSTQWTNATSRLRGSDSELSQFFVVRTNANATALYRLRISPNTNTAPETLSGHIIDFTTATGAAENFAFVSEKVLRSSIEGTGEYLYEANANTASFHVNFPSGSIYDLQMHFDAGGKTGTWTGTQFYDESNHEVVAGAAFAVQH